LLFNAGCIGQVFIPKPWKKFWHRSVLFSRKPKNDVTKPKAMLL